MYKLLVTLTFQIVLLYCLIVLRNLLLMCSASLFVPVVSIYYVVQ